jgi:GT2 family glycosyltransferase
MTVTVVVVTWNSAGTVSRCLTAIAKSTLKPDQIIVWDNLSIDATVSLALAHDAPVFLLRSTTNLGFAKGANAAVGEAVGDFIVLINPDAYVAPEALEELVMAGSGRTDAIVGGAIESADHTIDPSCARPFPSAWATARWLLGGQRESWDVPAAVQEVDAVSGALLGVHRTLWDELAGFDEGFRHSGEDLDLCWRAWRHGGRVVFVPSAVAVHLGGESVRQASAEIEVLRWSGLLAVVRRRQGRDAATALRLAVALRTLISVLATSMRVRNPSRYERRRARLLLRWALRPSTERYVDLPRIPSQVGT